MIKKQKEKPRENYSEKIKKIEKIKKLNKKIVE